MTQAGFIQPTTFLYQEKDAVATLTFNRPDKLNSLTFEVYAELRDTFAALQTRDDIRAVVIAGQGRGFCSGGDVNSIIGELFRRDMRGLLEFTRMTGDLIKNIRLLRKPVMASLNGVTAGAGAVIALACDLRIASETAKIAFLFVKVGLSGSDMGAAYLLPKVIGLSRATELLYTGDFISAQQAYDYGLYNRVVKPDELEKETQAWAEKLANGPAFSIGLTKEMLNRELNMDLLTALEAEAQAQALCMFNPDYREAYDAFVEKREPRFNQK
jgi:enoyl-CoA hydratase/carnithine racemase